MYKISCVKYMNSLPFIEGLKKSFAHNEIKLELDTPADCYQKLIDGKVDIGLVPVVALDSLKEKYFISSYGIGASGKVKSVILASNTDLDKIESIYLDYQSRTSVQLVQILAKHYWKIQPKFIPAKPGFVDEMIPKNSAYVVIGDRAFSFYESNYEIYDLSEEWEKYTGKNFVFATWIANKKIDIDFIKNFDLALKTGLDMRDNIIEDLNSSVNGVSVNLKEYYYQNINYNFGKNEREGMELFLNLLHKKKGG